MDRRSFLRALAAIPVAYELDVERLLWVPGQKTFFLPSISPVSYADILALEMERIIADDIFYAMLKASSTY